MTVDEVFNILSYSVLIVGIVITLIGIVYGIYKYKKTQKVTTLIAGVTGGVLLIVTAFLSKLAIKIINSPNQTGSSDPRFWLLAIIFVGLLFVSCKNRSK